MTSIRSKLPKKIPLPVDPQTRLIRAMTQKIVSIIPKKGTDYFDGQTGPQGPRGEKGEKGDKGDQGEPGTNGLNGKDGKNGKDGRDGRDGQDGRDADSSSIIKAILSELSKKKYTLADIDGLNEELTAIKTKKGGHSKTEQKITTTTSDNTTFNLNPGVQYNQLKIYLNGVRIFDTADDSANGFTYTTKANLVTSITLKTALVGGDILIIRSH